MGLKPRELRDTTLYDFNLMARAHNENIRHDYNIMRLNAFLVSAYSGLDGKVRKRLTPEKMFPLEQNSEPKKKDYTKAFAILEAVKKAREKKDVS